MQSLFSGIYKDKTVLVTGHTGFKGSWLCFWLKQMGANVIGYALEAPTTPNHFELLNLDILSITGNIKDLEHLNTVFQTYKPDIVFHLAAQALVKYSYENPIETYETNVIGTLKVFEACRNANTKAIVNITSDKAYENKEWIWGYKETDPFGGYDPYSSSKGCADILANSYRNSFFNPKDYKKAHNTLLASCRAGNVIGGGDWAKEWGLTPDSECGCPDCEVLWERYILKHGEEDWRIAENAPTENLCATGRELYEKLEAAIQVTNDLKKNQPPRYLGDIEDSESAH